MSNIKKLSHYEARIEIAEYQNASAKLATMQPLPSDFGATLVGRAQMITRDVLCVICKNPVDELLAHDWSKDSNVDMRKHGQICHEQCYQDYKKAREAEND